jgi:hypothetical protein
MRRLTFREEQGSRRVWQNLKRGAAEIAKRGRGERAGKAEAVTDRFKEENAIVS